MQSGALRLREEAAYHCNAYHEGDRADGAPSLGADQAHRRRARATCKLGAGQLRRLGGAAG